MRKTTSQDILHGCLAIFMSSNSGEENKIHLFLNKIIALEKWKLINFLFYCVLDIYIDKIFNICPKHFFISRF